MSDYRDKYGMDIMPGWEFGHSNSGIREFIKKDHYGTITHRMFVYPKAESPGQLEMKYQTSGMPRLTGYTYGTNHSAYENPGSGLPRLSGGKTRKNLKN
jgi:hypothetical protein